MYVPFKTFMSDSYELKILGVVILIEIVIAGVGATLDKQNTWIWMIIPSVVFSIIYFGFLRSIGRRGGTPYSTKPNPPKLKSKSNKKEKTKKPKDTNSEETAPKETKPVKKKPPPERRKTIAPPPEVEKTGDLEQDIEKEKQRIKEIEAATRENDAIVKNLKKNEEELKKKYEETQAKLAKVLGEFEAKENELEIAKEKSTENSEAEAQYEREFAEYETKKQNLKEYKKRGIDDFTADEIKDLKKNGILVNVKTKTNNPSERRAAKNAQAAKVQGQTPGDLAEQFETKWVDGDELSTQVLKLSRDLGVANQITKSEIRDNVPGARLKAFKVIMEKIKETPTNELAAKFNAMTVLSEASKLSSQEFEFYTPKEPAKPKVKDNGAAALQADIDRLNAQIEKLTDLLEKINGQVSAAGSDLNAANAEIAQMANEAEKARKALEASKAALASQAAAAEKAKEAGKARKAAQAAAAQKAKEAAKAAKSKRAQEASTAKFGGGARKAGRARGG